MYTKYSVYLQFNTVSYTYS